MKKFYSLSYDLKLLIPMCFKACPAYITIFFFISISHGLSMVFNTMAAQYFFEAISTAVSNSYTNVTIAIIIFAAVLIVQQLLNGFLNFMGWHMELKVNKKMIYEFHKKIANLKPIEFENTVELDKINKAANGARNMMEVGGTILMLMSFYIPYFLFMLFYLIKIKPMLVVILIFVFLPNFFTQYVRAKIFVKLEDESAPIRRRINYYTGCIADKEVRQWGTYSYFRNLLESNINMLGAKVWKSERKTGLWELLLNFCTVIGYICILTLLIYYLLIDQISIGAFSAIFASIDTMYSLMNEIICFHFGNLAKNIAIVSNYIEFMQEEQLDNNEVISFNMNEGLVIQNISFKYPSAKQFAIKNINLNIKQGETVAIVGENGAGKSTLLKLLIGLYEPTEGKVIIGGCDTHRKSKELYNHVSGVFQNYQRYKMTFRDNVAISDFSDVSDSKIIEIGNQIEIFSSIKVEDLLSTMLSREFDGIDLSGGQWQKVAIARGMYKCHEIIILDEPTAAIDPLEENYLYQRFAEMAKGKTAVIITHRLGAVKIADRIVLLRDGEIKEQGTHQELIETDGLYSEMFMAQSKWYR